MVRSNDTVPPVVSRPRIWEVIAANGKVIAKLSAQSTLGNGVVKVKPEGGMISDGMLATAVAVFAAVCGLQDV